MRPTVLLILLAGVGCASAAPPPADYIEEIPGMGIKFDMVGIPGDGAVKPFWMGRTEVTLDEFESYYFEEDPPVGADAVAQPSRAYEPHDSGWGSGRRPAIMLNRKSAEHYCRWLSVKTGRTYRLPTEAEWEHACRGGAATSYFFGDDPSKLGDYAWFKENSGGMTQEVGQKKQNPYGLFDILGNAMEYCSDPYGADDDRPVLRGGSWKDPPAELRSNHRQPVLFEWNERDPNRPRSSWWLYDGPFAGMRVVRSVDPP